MLTHLIFLLLALLLISLSPFEPQTQFASLIVYFFVLALIYLQNRFLNRFCFFLAQIELLLFLLVASSEMGPLISLGLYMAGIFWFHLTQKPAWNIRKAKNELFFLLPFILPFMFVTLLLEQHMVVLLSCLAALAIVMPYFMQRLWGCVEMAPSPLKSRLQALCDKAHFKHGGLKQWTVLDNKMTAAILGVIAPFRYILFTRKLMEEMAPDEIEAVLAHEIGHHQRCHLWIYPFIFLGIAVIMLLFERYGEPLLRKSLPMLFTGHFEHLTHFLIYGTILVLYIRFLYGFFSRLFERQADLHGFQLAIAPGKMISALQTVARASGLDVNAPNWHHYSIAERVAFLEQAHRDPTKIAEHHHYVRKMVLIYFVFLFFGVISLAVG